MATAYPTPRKVLEEVLRGSTQENLTAAAEALKRSRSEAGEFEKGALGDLDLAIKAYNQSLQKEDLTGSERTMAMLQLGKAHALRAMAEYSPYPQRKTIEPRHELVKHHLKEAAQYFVSYRKALGDPKAASQKLVDVAMKMVGVCDHNVEMPRLRRSLSASLGSHLLGGEAACYEGPSLPQARMAAYTGKQCFLHAVRALSGSGGTNNVTPVFLELKRACTTPPQRREEDEVSLLSSWHTVQQELMQGKTYLDKALHHLARGSSRESAGGVVVRQLTQDIRDLADQMKFLLQRGLVIRRLVSAAERQRATLQETAEFDMGACYDVVDLYREAESVADGLENAGVDTSGFEGCPRGADVEMLCIASHFHAKLLMAMGLTSQARAKHRFALCTALSLDPMAAGWDMPTSLLREKPWFMESKRVLEEAQRADREAEERERQEALGEIGAEVDALKRKLAECQASAGSAGADPRPLLKHLLERHPPPAVEGAVKNAVNSESEPIQKRTFLSVMRLYHPDKNPRATRREQLLNSEIMKVMNNFYETRYK